jgi:hypothetical protein
MGGVDDCSVNDIERLRPRINQLALDFHKLQEIRTADLDVRDQSIVLNGALNIVLHSSTAATKKLFSSRWHRSIISAMKLTRMFGLGRAASSK